MEKCMLLFAIAILFFLLSKFLNKDDSEEWARTEAVITSENEEDPNICYYCAEAYIDGYWQKGVSVYYKKSKINYSKGDRIKILYHPILSAFYTFEFKIPDTKLKRIENSLSKKIKICSIVCVCLTCILYITGCSNHDYTKEDATALLKKEHIKAEYVAEDTYEDDTVYRYKEKKTGIPFEVIEDHFLSGIDGATWNASKLFTNYPYVMTEHYIDKDSIDRGKPKAEYWNGGSVLKRYSVTYQSNTILDMESDMDEFERICRQLHQKNKNCRIGYSFLVSCTSNGDNVEFASVTDKEYNRKRLLEEYRTYVFAWYDEQYMSYLTEWEKQHILRHNEGRVYVEVNGHRKASGVISLRGNTWLSPGAFAELMREQGYRVEETDTEIYVTDIATGITNTHPKKSISYIEIEKTYDMRLSQPRWD